MKFMTMVRMKEGQGFPPQELFEGIAALGEEATRAGVMVDMGGLDADRGRRRSAAARRPDRDHRRSVRRGQGSRSAALPSTRPRPRPKRLKWVRKFLDLHVKHWPGHDITVEVRQYMEGPPPSP